MYAGFSAYIGLRICQYKEPDTILAGRLVYE